MPGLDPLRRRLVPGFSVGPGTRAGSRLADGRAAFAPGAELRTLRGMVDAAILAPLASAAALSCEERYRFDAAQ